MSVNREWLAVRRADDALDAARIQLNKRIAEWLPVGAIVEWAHGSQRRRARVAESADCDYNPQSYVTLESLRDGRRYAVPAMTLHFSEPLVTLDEDHDTAAARREEG